MAKKQIKNEAKKEVKEKVKKDIYIKIKRGTKDAELGADFSGWIFNKEFLVLKEEKGIYTFGNDARIKLGTVKKEDCEEL